MKRLIVLLCSLASAGSLPAAPACCPVTTATAASTPACCATEKPKPAPAKSEVPFPDRSLYQLDAKWTNDAGDSVELASLRGRPVVIAMFFASCGYACPMLVNDMQRLRAALPAEARAKARFVLVSFDTARDTPAALRAFRETSALDASWSLLHGETGPVQELAMLLGVKFKQDANGSFAHSNVFTVLNAEGEIVHQRSGLMGDVSDAAKAVALIAK